METKDAETYHSLIIMQEQAQKEVSLGPCFVTKSRINYAPRIMVARPLAVPMPRPLIALGPTRLNLRQKKNVSI